MIISVHIPKTAGRSFKAALKAAFGARLGTSGQGATIPWTPEQKAAVAALPGQLAAQAEETARRFDIVHGHFFARAFLTAFPKARYLVFLRDPVERVDSHYHFMRAREGTENPLHAYVKTLTLLDFAALPEGRNLQSQYCQGLALEDFAAFGLTHRFEESIALCNKALGLTLTVPPAVNVNPTRGKPGAGNRYGLNEETRAAIAELNAEDMALFTRAEALFEARLKAL